MLVIAAPPFIPASDDLRPFLAELWLVVGIAGNLLVPFATRRPNAVCAAVTLAALLFATGSLISIGAPGDGVLHFRGMLVFDSTALVAKITLLLFVVGVVVLWLGHSGRSLREGDGPEFFTLLLGSTIGMCLMTSTTNLLMIFMAVALASLPSYLLSGFRKASKRGAEASLKYVLFGAVTGAMMIYGISFLYGVYGTLQLGELVGRAPAVGTSAALSLAMLGLLIGIGFKISAVPFHFWCPDVFEGATIEVTTFLSVASKGAALILLLRVVQAIGNGVPVGVVVGILGVLTATVGNTAAFSQTNIKRLLAYSSIAQAGYMMCLISAASRAPSGQQEPVTQALLLYLIIYAVMNLGAFAVTAVVIRQNGERLENFAGLGRSAPLLAAAFFCCLISLIGLPPFAGFGAKVNVLWVLAHGGGFGIFLAAAIVINTVLSAFYYLRVVRVMYFDRGTDRSRAARLWSRDPVGILLSSACAAALVVMFFAFGAMYTVTSHRQFSPIVNNGGRSGSVVAKNS